MANGNDRRKDSIGAMIATLARIQSQRLNAGAQAAGMQPGFRRIHWELTRQDGVSQRELAHCTGLSAPTVSIALSKMQLEGLITRRIDEMDTRRVKVYLTEKGRALDLSMRNVFTSNEEFLTGPLTAEEKETLTALLEKMLDAAR